MSEPRRGLGRGLSALLDEAAAAGEGPSPATREVPIEQIHRNAAQPRIDFDEEAMRRLAEFDPRQGRAAADPGAAIAGATGRLPDRRGRASLAGGAGGGAGRRPDRAARPGRSGEPRDRHRRERAAQRPQPRRRGERLSGAGRALRPHPGGRGRQRRAQPQPRRQRAATARPAAADRRDAAPGPAVGGPCAGHRHGPQPGLAGASGGRTRPERARRRSAGRRALAEGGRGAKPTATKDADTRALEAELAQALGLAVDIAHKGGRGSVTIRYGTLEQLDDLCRRLRG